MLQSMVLQRVRHNFTTEQQQKNLPEEADWKGREAPGKPFLPLRQEPLGLGRDNLLVLKHDLTWEPGHPRNFYLPGPASLFLPSAPSSLPPPPTRQGPPLPQDLSLGSQRPELCSADTPSLCPTSFPGPLSGAEKP